MATNRRRRNNRPRTQAAVLADRQAKASKVDLAAAKGDVTTQPVDPDGLDGVVEGSYFEWGEGLFVEPDTGAVYDRGQQKARELKEMMGAYWKAQTLDRCLSLPIILADWKLVPGAGDTGEARDTEEKLRRPANAGGMSTPMRTVIGQMTSGFVYQRAFFAKGFKLDGKADDGSVMYSQLAFRPQTTCRLLRDRKDGSFAGFEQDVTMYDIQERRGRWNGRPIQFKPAQALVYIHGQDRDPVSGISDLEITYWCWRTHQKLLFLWLDYLAGQALPRTVVGSMDGDQGKAQRAAEVIATLKSSGVGYIDKMGLDISTLDVSGKGAQQYKELIDYIDRAASGSIVAFFTELGNAAAQGRGSLALSTDLSDFFLQSRMAASHEIEECLTNFGVADLIRYNYGPDGVCPTFQFEPLAAKDQQPVLDLLKSFAGAQPGGPIPFELIAELAIECARILGLDVDKVRAAVEKSARDAAAAAAAAGESQDAQGAKAVGAATGTLASIAGRTRGR